MTEDTEAEEKQVLPPSPLVRRACRAGSRSSKGGSKGDAAALSDVILPIAFHSACMFQFISRLLKGNKY